MEDLKKEKKSNELQKLMRDYFFEYYYDYNQIKDLFFQDKIYIENLKKQLNLF